MVIPSDHQVVIEKVPLISEYDIKIMFGIHVQYSWNNCLMMHQKKSAKNGALCRNTVQVVKRKRRPLQHLRVLRHGIM